jgi:type IV pilus assembly protein PilM
MPPSFKVPASLKGAPSLKLPSSPKIPSSLRLPSSLKGVRGFNLNFGRRPGADVVGLDIQPGLIAAVQASVNGSILAQRAAVMPLAGDLVREGEVVDAEALGEALRELFDDGGLSKRVRVGIANQRTVMRTLELPPVTDHKELAAAVRFQAQDQVPMPLNNAVLDFHPLGVIDTPAGPRQRVVLVAAQRDMVERLLSAVRSAGLRPEGVDLSAFALIRSLYRTDEDHSGRVLYLNVDGLTNLAIAEGTVCRFTRVVGGGMEAMAVELAERRGIALTEARALLSAVDLTASATPEQGVAVFGQAPPDAGTLAQETPDVGAHHETSGAERPEEEAFGAAGQDEEAFDAEPHEEPASDEPASEAEALSADELDAQEAGMSYYETVSAAAAQTPAPSDADVRMVLENGIREISGEVRNSLEFHRSQEDGGEVSHVALSGSALDIPGFAEALQTSLGVEVRGESVGVTDASLAQRVSVHRLSVAAGLATTEAPQ